MLRMACISGFRQQRWLRRFWCRLPTVAVGAGPSPGVVVQPQAAPVPESMDDKLAQLERLAQLKAQGILTEEEFAAQKSLILGS